MGLHFAANLSYGDWERAGTQLSRIVSSSAWCLGDWLVRGQENYPDRYVRAVETAGLDYQTLRNYAWVARCFPMRRRRERLSFQHHAEVAALDVARQDEWLDRAEEGSWSRNELRRRMRAHRQGAAAITATTSLLPRVPVARERVERWRAAARRVDNHLEHWMVVVLDHAAENVLGAETP
ncbi:LmbU family transcriptional regulator [Saccharothrix sp. SC076]|nr:LmbU family transcriptional regulator [Saccharothrix obliqua]